MLCNNFLEGKVCSYGDKCLYAHSIKDQNIDPIKKKAYDIILNEFEYNTDKIWNKNIK